MQRGGGPRAAIWAGGRGTRGLHLSPAPPSKHTHSVRPQRVEGRGRSDRPARSGRSPPPGDPPGLSRDPPVFPDVGSMMVSPGFRIPACSASSIMRRLIRSFTLPPALKNSHLATGGRGRIRTGGPCPLSDPTASRYVIRQHMVTANHPHLHSHPPAPGAACSPTRKLPLPSHTLSGPWLLQVRERCKEPPAGWMGQKKPPLGQHGRKSGYSWAHSRGPT